MCMGCGAGADCSSAPGLKPLVLHVYTRYFDEIKAGTKTEEYRQKTPKMRRALVGRTYSGIIICKGYPRLDDPERTIRFPWKGYREMTVSNTILGKGPIEVFAIRLERET